MKNTNPVRPAQIPTPQWKRPEHNGYRETAIAVAAGLVFCTAFLGLGARKIYAEHSARTAAAVAAAERPKALERLLAAPAGETLPAELASHGRDLYTSACIACHGQGGIGGIGKNLSHSWFMASLNDQDLLNFIKVGRAADHPENTTKIPMPAKGGQDHLTDEDLTAIVAYLRGVQDPRRMPELREPAVITIAVSEDDKQKALAAAGGDPELAEWIASGSKLFAGSCSACHGKDARGVAGSGKSLVDNPFCSSLDDDALLAFIKKGRDPSDPANTTGIGMPAKGGNPALSDDDILDIIAFLRSLDTTESQN